MSTPAKQQTSTKPKESVSEDMKELSVAEPVNIKSNNLDVLAEYRKVKRKNAANFVVIGESYAIFVMPPY
jgi:elongation factor 1 alpha-like protein